MTQVYIVLGVGLICGGLIPRSKWDAAALMLIGSAILLAVANGRL